jgi:hypothetical protein
MECYLQLDHLEVRRLLEVDHGLGQESLDQLVGVVLWLREGVYRVYALLGWTLTLPVEAHVAGALVSELEPRVGVGTVLADAAEHEESLLGLLEEGVVLPDESGGRVLSARLLDLYQQVSELKRLTLLHLLVEHDPAHVLDVEEVLALEELADVHDVLLLDPDEQDAVLHHALGDHQLRELLH